MTLVVDTSAVVAILLDEPERVDFASLMVRREPVMSAGSLIETLRVLRVRRGNKSGTEVWSAIKTLAITVLPVGLEQVHLSEEGMERFGKGRREPPAVLNFGDLFAYALARHLDAPLLFKGEHFLQTDVRVAWTP